MSEQVDYLLQLYSDGDHDAAFFGPLETSNEFLPLLQQRFQEATDSSLRTFLVRVIWQHRSPSVAPFLAEVLRESPHDESWKEALDGLVALNCAESDTAIQQSYVAIRKESPSDERSEWLREAVEQIAARRTNTGGQSLEPKQSHG